MQRQEKEPRWRRLDNTAKLFPVIANENLSNVFRVSVTLKEMVCQETLQQALEDVLPEMKGFQVKLRRGVFWYYFEENQKIPQVQKEASYPCRYIDPHANQKFLFRVTYYEKRINFEVFHALTDGLGAANFLKELTYRYLRLKRNQERDQIEFVAEDKMPRIEIKSNVEDSYLRNYKNRRKRHYSSKTAFRLYGNYLPWGVTQVIHGYLKLPELKQVCKGYGVSVTKYLTACLIWAIYQEYLEGKPFDRSIAVNLPINLRAFFDSETSANFFAVTTISFLTKQEHVKFEQILSWVSRQMDKKIVKEKLEESISYNVSNEKKWYIRVTPLFLKWIALNIVFRMKEKNHTTTLSNVGLIHVHPEYEQDIERFHMLIGVSRRQPMKCGVCSYGEEVAVTFTSVFCDSCLQRRFFKKLKTDGISVRMEGNEVSEMRKTDAYPHLRKVLVLRKGGGAKATRLAHKVEDKGKWAARGLFDYASGSKNLKQELKRRFHV